MTFRPKKIFIVSEASDYPLARKILRSLDGVDIETIDDVGKIGEKLDLSTDPIGEGKKYLILAKNKGSFIKSCPGTAHPYICCGYRIANFYLNCNIDCTYCILQAYLNNPFVTINVNLDDMARELDELVGGNKNLYFRIGTGELGDSLSLDPITAFTHAIQPFLTKHDNLTFEYKTKSDRIENLKNLDHRGKIVVSWSLNSERIVRNAEKGSVSIGSRLKAAAQCEEWGYKLGFHFDPIIDHENWQENYRDVIDRIFSHVSAESIAWISMGCFRFMPRLKDIIERRFPHSEITHHEFIAGIDKKMRYFKTLRMEMYSILLERVRKQSREVFVYLCMESREVWESVFGYSPKNMAELSDWLDKRC